MADSKTHVIMENDTQSNIGIVYMENTAAGKHTAERMATEWMTAISSSQAYHSLAACPISGPNPNNQSYSQAKLRKKDFSHSPDEDPLAFRKTCGAPNTPGTLI